MNGGVIEIGWLGLAGAAALILVNAAASVALKLGLGKKLAVASVRTVVQLLLLGYLLVPVFELGQPWLVAALGVVMIAIAARESLRRAERTYRRAWLDSFATLFVAASVTAIFGSAVLVGVEPFWLPRYFIPLLGMLLGNALNGISLGIDQSLRELDEGRGRIEARLALGATWWEAVRPAASGAIRNGMIPILNAMSVVGIVSIPGMMTGQLLGGTSPEQAARYQILILFMIAATVAMGTVGAVLLGVRRIFDDRHRLRVERILER